MENGCRDVPVVELTLQETIGQVDVFAVHEELLVKDATSLDGLTAAEHEGSADNLNLGSFVMVEISHIILAEGAAAGEETTKSSHLAEGHPRRREATTTLKSEITIDVEHLNADSTHILMGLSMMEAVMERVLSNDGVRIEEEDVLTLRLANGKVVGAAETHIAATGNDVKRGIIGSGKDFADVLDAMIRRVVVNDEDLYIETALTHRSPHAAEALAQVVFDVIGYDDD